MTDYMVFGREIEAVQQLQVMRGWPKKSTAQVYLPDNPCADEDGNVWVVCAADGKYLRRNGFVR